MLVLTRTRNQVIRVGHDVRITVMAVKGGQVKVGITAPENVRVDREEIYLRKQQEKLGLRPVTRGIQAP